ncbi:hypothetical protein V6N11_045169, partial [Hibiscus sabdariffa]
EQVVQSSIERASPSPDEGTSSSLSSDEGASPYVSPDEQVLHLPLMNPSFHVQEKVRH